MNPVHAHLLDWSMPDKYLHYYYTLLLENFNKNPCLKFCIWVLTAETLQKDCVNLPCVFRRLITSVLTYCSGGLKSKATVKVLAAGP